jgi:hypothetical protein
MSIKICDLYLLCSLGGVLNFVCFAFIQYIYLKYIKRVRKMEENKMHLKKTIQACKNLREEVTRVNPPATEQALTTTRTPIPTKSRWNDEEMCLRPWLALPCWNISSAREQTTTTSSNNNDVENVLFGTIDIIRETNYRRRLDDIHTDDDEDDDVLFVKEERAFNLEVKRFKFQKCESCSICFEDYKNGDDVGQFDQCEHTFHTLCLDQWLQKKKDCPMCRKTLL